MRSLLRIARNGLRLDGRARRHALRAVAWLILARVTLALVSYAAARRAAARIQVRTGEDGRMTALESARAIARAGRVLPWTRCLDRSLAAECLLRREGLPLALRIGVAFDAKRRLHAHSWVESGDIVITGGDDAGSFVPLATLQP